MTKSTTIPNDQGTDIQRHDRLAGRVDVLESNMVNLTGLVEKSAHNNDENFKVIYQSIDALKTTLGNVGKTDWKLMVSILGVALTTLLMFSGFVLMQVRPVEKENEEQRQSLVDNSRWHLDATAIAARTDERILQGAKITELIMGRIDRNYAEMQTVREEVTKSREAVAALRAVQEYKDKLKP